MLVITRKVCEEIVIGGDTVITICWLDRYQVRVGVTAPDGVLVLRRELVTEDTDWTRRERGAKS